MSEFLSEDNFVGFDTAQRISELFEQKFSSFPTQSLVCKWLREKFKIHISVNYTNIIKNHWYCEITGYGNPRFVNYTSYYSSYEKALEAGINVAMDKIEEVKNKKKE